MCIGPLNGSLWLQPSLSGRQKLWHFSHLDVWVPFWFWCCRLRSPGWVSDPTLLRGEHPWATEFPSGTLAAILGSLTSPPESLPCSILVTLWWSSFFCLFMVTRFLSSYCSVGYSGWFLYNLVIIPDWSWEDVSVASTYSSAILDPDSVSKISQFLNHPLV